MPTNYFINNLAIGHDTPTENVHIKKTGANAGLKVERASGASLLFQSQASLVRIGTDNDNPLSVIVNDTEIGRFISTGLELADGNAYKIDGSTVLTETGLGASVVSSSLASVGTLSSLTVSGNLTVDTNSLFVNASNNRVGIGTTSPNQKLSVVIADTSSTPALLIGQGDASARSALLRNHNDATTFDIIASASTSAAKALTFNSYDGNEIARFNTDGEFGIGTTSPEAPLHVVTSSTSDTFILESTDAGSSGAPDFVLYRNSSSPAANDNIGNIRFRGEDSAGNSVDYAYISGVIEDPTNGAEDGAIALGTIVGASGPSEKVRITSAGNMGIGTNSPGQKLDVQGVLRLRSSSTTYAHIDANSGSNLDLIANAGQANVSPAIRFLSSTSGGSITERVRIDSAGNFGIGITPTKKLHVDSGSSSDIARLENDNGTITFGYTAGLASIDLSSTEELRVRAGASELLRIDDTGNFGIGTTTPGAKLEVYQNSVNGSIREIGVMNAGTQSAGSSGSGINITFKHGLGYYGAVGGYSNGSAGFGVWSGTNTGAPDIFINNSGNVGIGTAAPEVLLQASTNFSVKSDGVIRWGSDVRAASRTDAGYLSWDTNKVIIGATESGDSLELRSAGVAAINIDSSQKVGIGVASPSEALDVSGNIQSTGGIDPGANDTPLKMKVIEIGDWDWSSADSIYIDTGIDKDNWRTVSVVVRSDSPAGLIFPIDYSVSASYNGSWTYDGLSTSSTIKLERPNISSSAFDNTSYNRGWITIWYV